MTKANCNRRYLASLIDELRASYGVELSIHECLHRLFALPGFLQDVICLHFDLNYSPSEIADTLNISETLVQRRISVSTTLIKILYASKPKNPV